LFVGVQLFLYPLLEEYKVYPFVEKYVTGTRKLFRPYEEFIFLIRINKINYKNEDVAVLGGL